MSRDFTSGMEAEIEAPSMAPIFLMEFEFPGGTLRFWTGYGNIVWDSNTYVGSGTALKPAQPRETQNMEAAGVTFELSTEDSSILSAALTADYQGRLCRQYFASWDETAQDFVSDPYLEFEGIMDVMTTQDRGDESLIVLHAEDELVLLRKPLERRRTSEDQKKNYPGDEFFDFVAGLQNKETPWGPST